MRKIKVAQIGINSYAHSTAILKSVKTLSDVFEVAGYAFVEDEEKDRHKYKELLDGCDEITVDEIMHDSSIEAVIIETEEKHLLKYALMAAENGKHIHMEKPGSQNLEDFEKLVNIMKEKNLVFHIGYMYRYNPYVREVIEKAKNGKLGEISGVEAHMSCKHDNKSREWLSGYKGGMMFYLGCHLIDLIVSIQGVPKKIYPFNKCTNLDGINTEDFTLAVLEYDNGVSFAKTVNTEIGGFDRRQLVVTGTKGMVEIRPLENMDDFPLLYTVKREHLDENAGWLDKGVESKSELFDRYNPMMKSFAQKVCGEKENLYTYEYELGLFKVILKCCGII